MVNFKLIDTEFILDKIMKLSASSSDSAYQSMGIKSTNMLKNMGTFLLAFVALIVVVILLFTFRLFMLKFQLTTKLYKLIESKIFYNSLIRSFLTSYLTMCISTFISIQNLKTETRGDLISTALTIVALVLVVIAPYLAYLF